MDAHCISWFFCWCLPWYLTCFRNEIKVNVGQEHSSTGDQPWFRWSVLGCGCQCPQSDWPAVILIGWGWLGTDTCGSGGFMRPLWGLPNIEGYYWCIVFHYMKTRGKTSRSCPSIAFGFLTMVYWAVVGNSHECKLEGQRQMVCIDIPFTEWNNSQIIALEDSVGQCVTSASWFNLQV